MRHPTVFTANENNFDDRNRNLGGPITGMRHSAVFTTNENIFHGKDRKLGGPTTRHEATHSHITKIQRLAPTIKANFKCKYCDYLENEDFRSVVQP